jgi:hypothetical protein
MASKGSGSGVTPTERTGHPYYMYESIQVMPRVLGQCLEDDGARAVCSWWAAAPP